MEKIQTNYSLKDLATFKIGGPAEYFIDVETKEELEQAIAWAKTNNFNITFLGGGSNILVSDQGVKGLVIKISNKNLSLVDTEIVAGAGVKTQDVAKFSLDYNLTGLEWAIGIPGSLGGAVRGNAGAHGSSFDQSVTKVEAFDLEKNQWLNFSKDDIHFNYRHSLFKENPSLIIWEAALNLSPCVDKLEQERKVTEYKKYRQDLQPPEPSAGCIFKNFFFEAIKQANPILALEIEAKNKVRGGKVGAGYIVELLNLKGFISGGAKISERHANFIVNYNSATGQDVLAIIDEVKKQAKNKLNLDMTEEVQRLGW